MNIETRIQYLSQRAFEAEAELARWRLLALAAIALCVVLAVYLAVQTAGAL